MTTLNLTLRSEIDEITGREGARAAGILTVLLDHHHGHRNPFGSSLENIADCGSPKRPRADLHEFTQRLKVRQRLISSAIAKLMAVSKSQPEPPSRLAATGVVS